MPPALTQPHTRRRLPAACLLLAMACLPALPQTTPSVPSAGPRASEPASGLYRIAGTVVNAVTGEPVRGATVAALSYEDSHTVASVQSDKEGRFSLQRLPAAKYQLTASKRGFRTAFYDQHDEFSTAIVTGPDQETESLTFRLTPGAVLRGVVTGDGGDPVENAAVMLFLKPNGHRTGARITKVDAASTDDTGAYEFGNLAPGEYLLAVKAEPWFALHRPVNELGQSAAGSSNAALDVAYPVTFFDSTTDEASAMPIVLAGGSLEEADIAMQAVPALHLLVETPRNPDGTMIAAPALRQTIFGEKVALGSLVPPIDPRQRPVEFNGLAPGRYELRQGDPPRVGELDATASQQVDASLGTPTVAVSGTLRTASGAALPDKVTLALEPLDSAHGQEPMSAECAKGQCSFDSVLPGKWELWAESSGKPLPIVSVEVGGRTHPGNLLTVRDRPLSVVVTVSAGVTRIEGFASRPGVAGDGSSSLGWKPGNGVAGVLVVLVPKEPAAFQSLVRRDQSDSDGSFALRDVAPGQYTLVAIEDAWALDYESPEVIARYLPGGIAVTITNASGKLVRLSQPVPVQTR